MKSVASRNPSNWPANGNVHPDAPVVPGCTYDEISSWQLKSICGALGLGNSTQRYLELQRFLFEPWGSRPVPASPAYPSCIGDDHSPYEYSLAFSGGSVELRILLEAQAKEPTARAIQAAGLEMNARLEQRFGIDLSRFDRVSELFLPEAAPPGFSLWHAVCLNEGRAPEFKLYLNPQARGKDDAPALVTEAMERLGFGDAAKHLFAAVARRGAQLDEVRYFSLDLSSREDARVKVYFAHHGATVRDLERAFRYAPTHVQGDVEEYLHIMAGQAGPFRMKPITSCFAFVAGRQSPSAVTMHYPIAHYEYDDERIAQRVSRFLTSQGDSVDAYRRTLASLARRPLENGAGMQSYASFRRERNQRRLTVYLSPELFSSMHARSGTKIVA